MISKWKGIFGIIFNKTIISYKKIAKSTIFDIQLYSSITIWEACKNMTKLNQKPLVQVRISYIVNSFQWNCMKYVPTPPSPPYCGLHDTIANNATKIATICEENDTISIICHINELIESITYILTKDILTILKNYFTSIRWEQEWNWFKMQFSRWFYTTGDGSILLNNLIEFLMFLQFFFSEFPTNKRFSWNSENKFWR